MKEACEKYRKYLLEIEFRDVRYYSVFGSDMTDHFEDRLLVNQNGKIILSKNITTLTNFILKEKFVFDKVNFDNWAREINLTSIETSKLNFDLLNAPEIELDNKTTLFSLFTTIGCIEDYAIQVVNDKLLAIFSSDILIQFKNDAMVFFVWKGNDSFKTDVDVTQLTRLFRDIYFLINEYISVL